MQKNDSLGDRMKKYEFVSKTKLMARTPVIIRIDGKAFHTLTKHFNKPYDLVLSNAMASTMKDLCSNIQGCVFGYTQSDEITLVLVDYQTLNTCAFFDNEVQKLCSVTASMATAYFKNNFENEIISFIDNKKYFKEHSFMENDLDFEKLLRTYIDSKEIPIMFDSRCFNIPKEEVCNCLIWRQQDATRNSIEMLGRYYFKNKDLYKKNTSNIQDMLIKTYNINWNNVPTRFKRGLACIKKDGKFIIDEEMPILTQDRNYVEQWIYFE